MSREEEEIGMSDTPRDEVPMADAWTPFWLSRDLMALLILFFKRSTLPGFLTRVLPEALSFSSSEEEEDEEEEDERRVVGAAVNACSVGLSVWMVAVSLLLPPPTRLPILSFMRSRKPGSDECSVAAGLGASELPCIILSNLPLSLSRKPGSWVSAGAWPRLLLPNDREEEETAESSTPPEMCAPPEGLSRLLSKVRRAKASWLMGF